MQQTGQFILHITFLTTLATVVVAFIGARVKSLDLMRAARYGVYAVCLLNAGMAAVMIQSLLSHDFKNMYIATYTDVDMPTAYVLAAFWGGEKGALLLWVTVLGAFSAIAVTQNRHKEPVYMAWTTGILMSALLFFYILMVFEASPFEQFLTFAGPEDGQGMNPLLQNPTMTIHPPSLLTGFIAFTLPFAFGLAALITGRLDDEWTQDTRTWTIVCWVFLTTGLILGGAWAYEELGWGGYWMWDPVENAGLIPWFTATAFLHSVMIQERRRMLRRWNFFLVLLTFLLTIFGTFLTRSQLIDSIHAFADSKLSMYFLWYMVVIGTVSTVALAYRWREMAPDARIDHFLSRESFFVLNNILLLGSAFVVLWGTLFSKVSEAETFQSGYNKVVGLYNATLGGLLGPMEQLTQAVILNEPWFNRVMVPIGLLLLLLTGIGPVISWRKATRKNFRTNLQKPLLWSSVVSVLGAIAWGVLRVTELRSSMVADAFARWFDDANAFVGKLLVMKGDAGDAPAMPVVTLGDAYGRWADSLGRADVYAFLAFFFSALVVATVGTEFWRGTRLRQSKAGGAFVFNLMLLTIRTPRRYGGYIIHLGVVMCFIAFAGAVFKDELPEQPLYPGDRIAVGGYHVTFARSDDIWHADGAYVSSKATMVALEGEKTVPQAAVDALAGRLESAGLVPFHVETFRGNPAVRLRFGNEEHRRRVQEDLYVRSYLLTAFEVLDAPKDKAELQLQLRDMDAVAVVPQLMMKTARNVREFFEDQGGTVKASFVPGSPLLALRFPTVDARDAWLARAEGEPLLRDVVGGWMDPDTGAVEIVPAGVGSLLYPEVRFYKKHGTPTTEIAIQSKVLEDLYLAMRPAAGQPFINLLAVVFPLVSFLWAGTLIMIIGALICLLPRSITGLARGAGAALIAGVLLVPHPAAAQDEAFEEGHGDEIPLVALPDDGITTVEDARTRLLEALRCPDRKPGGYTIRDEPLLECATASGEELRARLDDDLARLRALPPRDAMHRVLEGFLHRDPANERLLRFGEADFHHIFGRMVCTCGCTGGMALSKCPLSCGNSKSWKTRFKVLLAEGFDREQAKGVYLASVNAARPKGQAPYTVDDLDADPQKALSWVVPAVVIGGAAVTFVSVMAGMKRRRAAAAAAPPAPQLSEADRRLLKDELEERDD
ncbi:MAG: hypothetical protein AMXMBFR64_14230 [Myxococcales bacterium]